MTRTRTLATIGALLLLQSCRLTPTEKAVFSLAARNTLTAALRFASAQAAGDSSANVEAPAAGAKKTQRCSMRHRSGASEGEPSGKRLVIRRV